MKIREKNTRAILHSDLNNFYASVECMLDPSLKKYPIAVCGKTEERHGIVLAKNYAAKACGVSTGESIYSAKTKCPKLVTVDPHYGEYLKYSHLVRSIYLGYSDRVEAYGMDENWIDLTDVYGMDDPVAVAHEIRERVKCELGLTVSIGVSFNKIFAKLGSDMKKPDAVTSIPEESFRESIWQLPASDMLGVGRAASKELERYGIQTIGQLACCSDALLTSKFGINGLRMKKFANGGDTSEVMNIEYSAPIKSVGNGITFLADLHETSEVKPMILALADKVAGRLREAGKKANGVSLTVKCSDLSYKEWQCGLDRLTSNAFDIADRAFELFCGNYPWVKPIRAMTVRAIRLSDSHMPEQLSLFGDNIRSERLDSMDSAIDSIRIRYGKQAITSAATLRLDKFPYGSEESEVIMPTGMLTVG